MSLYITISKDSNIFFEKPLEFHHSNWKVALTEVFLPSHLPQFLKNEILCTVKTQFTDGYETEDLRAKNDLYFDSFERLVQYLHSDFLFFHFIGLAYVDNRIVLKSKFPNESTVKFNSKIAYMFGVEPNTYFSNIESDKLDLFGGIYNIYLYSPIVQPQYIGNTRASLLKILNINRNEKHTHIIYKKPQYLNISHSYISQIQLDFRDLTGEKIHFPKGINSFTLHFKQFDG